MSCVCSFSPARGFLLKAVSRLFAERMVTGGTLIRQNVRHRKLSLAILNEFGTGIVSGGSASAMHNRTPRTKQSHDLLTKRRSSSSLRRTWTICTRAPVWRQKRWCKFMATFLSRAAHAAHTSTSMSMRFRDAPNAMHSCDRALSGSASSCRGANYSELKVISMAELAMS